MARYRTKSADVLSEADRAQRILEWRIFQLEQEAILYGGDRWKPGDCLYRTPSEIREAQEYDWEFFDEYPSEDDLEGSGPGFWGNCMRPIFQTMEFAEDNLGEGPGTRYEWVLSYPVDPRCADCEVSWNREGGDNCWMCGESYPWPEPRAAKPMFYSRQRLGDIDDVRMTIDGVEVRGTLNFDIDFNTFNFEPALGAMRSMQEAAAASAQAFRRISEHYHAVMSEFVFDTQDFSVPSEMMNLFWGGPTQTYALNRNVVQQYVPPTNPFEREEREIVLVEPVAPVLPEWSAYRRPTLDIPSGWEADVFGYIDERFVPQRSDLDHLRQHTQVQQSAWPGIEIVTERRRE